MNIAQLIDHTLLKPDATGADIDRLSREARAGGFFAVCVNPVHVRRAAAGLQGSPVKVCAVAGFPLGANRTETKLAEARLAVADGASEIDAVLDIGALRSGDTAAVRREIGALADFCRQSGACCKIILETALLQNVEKEIACALCVQAGVNFVKTSTGFGPGGATAADVALLSRLVKPHGLGVKASGGIRTLADLQQMVAAGATRIGTSHGVKILAESGLVG